MRKHISVLLIPLALISILLLNSCDKKAVDVSTVDKEWQIEKSATCAKAGVRKRVLASGKTETEEIKALGHNIIIDGAVEATCTTPGKTEGSHCSRCGEIFKEQEVIEAHHTLKNIPSVNPTCVRAGRTAGERCTVCDKIVTVQKKIRPLGHNYVDGICTRCKCHKPDKAASLFFDQFNEEKASNFITKKAYKGGSTITFGAYVNEESSWWAVCYTTDSGDIGLYKWAKGKAYGTKMESVKGKWENYTVTLPDTEENYYIYFAGAKCEWKGNGLLVDDVKISNPEGIVIDTDDFDNSLYNSIFSVIANNPGNGKPAVFDKTVCYGHVSKSIPAVEATCIKAGQTGGSYCSECGKVLTPVSAVVPLGHNYKEGVCTRCGQEYENVAVAINIDLLNEQAPMNFITREAYSGGSTITFKAKSPADLGKTWWSVCYTTDPGNVGIYNWTKGEKYGKSINTTSCEWTNYSITLPNTGDSYYIYIVGAKCEWKGKRLLLDDFRITDASGNLMAEDNFDLGLQNGIFSVTTSSVPERAVVSTETITDPCKKGHTVVIDKAIPASCTVGGKTEGSHCSVCNAIINAQQDVPATGHKYNDQGVCVNCGDKKSNKAAAIYIDLLNEQTPMNFITKEAYSGGSTINFKGKVPSESKNTWWAVCYTTDPKNVGLYSWTKGAANGKLMTSVYGEWNEYSVKLPDTDKKYYIYIVGAKNEWKGKALLIDDFSVTTDGNTVTDNFNESLTTGLFNVTAINSGNKKTVVRLEELVLENLAAALKIDSFSDQKGKMSFITKNAYSGGSIINFRAFVPQGVSWWAVSWTTDSNDATVYKFSGHPEFGKSMVSQTQYGVWCNYEVALPADDKKYYIYIVGAKGEWKGNSLLLDDFSITINGITVTDDFNGGVSANLFNADNSVTAQTK